MKEKRKNYYFFTLLLTAQLGLISETKPSFPLVAGLEKSRPIETSLLVLTPSVEIFLTGNRRHLPLLSSEGFT